MTIFVGVGDLAVSTDPGAVIKTMALGSCIAVCVFGKSRPAVGMLHLQLPESSINPELAKKRPAMFADTGITLLLTQMQRLGFSPRDLVIKLAGGAQVMDPNNTFNIGKRNYLATKKILWAQRLWPLQEDVGGTFSRTVTLNVGKASLHISSPGKPDWEI